MLFYFSLEGAPPELKSLTIDINTVLKNFFPSLTDQFLSIMFVLKSIFVQLRVRQSRLSEGRSGRVLNALLAVEFEPLINI